MNQPRFAAVWGPGLSELSPSFSSSFWSWGSSPTAAAMARAPSSPRVPGCIIIQRVSSRRSAKMERNSWARLRYRWSDCHLQSGMQFSRRTVLGGLGVCSCWGQPEAEKQKSGSEPPLSRSSEASGPGPSSFPSRISSSSWSGSLAMAAARARPPSTPGDRSAPSFCQTPLYPGTPNKLISVAETSGKQGSRRHKKMSRTKPLL